MASSTEPLVSVILSAYNDGPFILRSVGSVLDQTFTDFEFIVINDGSTDDTHALLDAFADERLRVVHQENRGLLPCLAMGLAMARGKYVARLDGDDRSAPERLERQVQFLESHPGHVVVGSWWRIRSSGGQVVGEYRCPTSDLGLRWRTLFDIGFPHSSMMMRASALEGVGGYDPSFEFAQDYDLLVRLSGVGRMAAIPAFLTDWHLDERDGRSVRHRLEQRAYVRSISKRQIARFGGESATDDDLDALWRIVEQPSQVNRDRAARGAWWLRRLGAHFVEAHGAEARFVVRDALGAYARALLLADAPGRSVLWSRMRAVLALAPRELASAAGVRATVRAVLGVRPT